MYIRTSLLRYCECSSWISKDEVCTSWHIKWLFRGLFRLNGDIKRNPVLFTIVHPYIWFVYNIFTFPLWNHFIFFRIPYPQANFQANLQFAKFHRILRRTYYKCYVISYHNRSISVPCSIVFPNSKLFTEQFNYLTVEEVKN